MLPKRRRYAEHRYDYVNGPYYSPRPRKNGPIVRIVPSGLSHRQIGPSVQIGPRGSRVPLLRIFARAGRTDTKLATGARPDVSLRHYN
jgi:hypothetical protein